MLILKTVNDMTDAEWDDFVLQHPAGMLFHTSKWLNMLEKNQKLRQIRLAIYDQAALIGLFPFFVREYGPLIVGASPFVVEDTPYMGPVIDNRYMPDTMIVLYEFLKKEKIDFGRIISFEFYDHRSLPRRCEFIEKHTHILDLTQDEEMIWKNMEGRCRTAIKKAAHSGITIKIATDKDYVDVYFSIIQRVYYRQNKNCPNSKSFYCSIWDNYNAKNAVFLYAQYENTIIAGAIIIFYRDRAYYLNGASKHEFNAMSPNNLIQWEAIRLAKSRGIKFYDFVGSDIPRLAQFKKSFGGKIHPYSCTEIPMSYGISVLRHFFPAYKNTIGKLYVIFDKFRRKEP